MILNNSDFGYLQARLQARHGQRPDAATWRRLNGTVDVGGFLNLARATGLAPWVESIRTNSNAAALERVLRNGWFAHVANVASWSPTKWRDAVRWWSTLPLLAVKQHAQSGGASRRWIGADPVLSYRFEDSNTAPPPLQFRGLPLQALQGLSGLALRRSWSETWQSLWPRSAAANERRLDDFTRHIEHSWHEVNRLDPGATSNNTLLQLERDLVLMFRRGASSAVAVFCSLSLTALELQQLRGALVTRLLFRGQPEHQAWQ